MPAAAKLQLLERLKQTPIRRATDTADSRRQDELWDRYAADPLPFITECCHIFDKVVRKWVLFGPWPCQKETIVILHVGGKVIILKARQQGFTWVVLCFLLWLCIFRPVQQAYLFSVGDREAKDLTAFRLAGIWHRLPQWLRDRCGKPDISAHGFGLPNGSRVASLPSNAGRSFAATFVMIDEADYGPDLGKLLESAEPAVGEGGQLVLLSTSDKSKPNSPFKNIYRAAKKGEAADYRPLFFGWDAHPGRNADWHALQVKKSLATTGSLDYVHQEYPATDAEALAPRSLDKRFPAQWLTACYREGEPLSADRLVLSALEAPTLPPSLLSVYVLPVGGRSYVVSGDPAAGNPTSDESAATVLDEATGEQVAVLAGRIEPAVFASYVYELSQWYNNAPILIEQNNHGHAVLLWLRENGRGSFILCGPHGDHGWQTTTKSKALLLDCAATRFREGRCLIRDPDTYYQLASVEGATLKAPEGEFDDRAIAYCLAVAAIDQCPKGVCKVWV